MSTGIEVRLLGPLEVVVPGGGVEFEGAKQRRLFVALALRAPEAVSVDELVEAVWGDDAPDGREQALQKQVSRLRARAGRAAAGAPARGRLRAGDRARGDRQPPLRGAARARASTRADPARAAGQLASALALWRGPALADHRVDEFAQSEIARLEELRLEAIEERLGGRAGAGPRRRPRRRAARAGGRAPAARAAARAADAGALPRRAPGGRARGDARGPPVPGRRARARARPGAAPAGGA